jgi:hypothetical protein
MWTSRTHQIDPQTTKVILSGDRRDLSFRDVIGLWQNSDEFREFFKALIIECPFDAFFLETPPVTQQTLDRSFEFVLVEGASLSRLRPDPSPFRSQFSSRQSEGVLTFPNLGGDAILVVPVPLTDDGCYTHLAKFLRNAPRSQIGALWRSTGLAMQTRISSAPTWLSTAGMGVSWLHLRLDSRPKYYRYEPYKAVGES